MLLSVPVNVTEFRNQSVVHAVMSTLRCLPIWTTLGLIHVHPRIINHIQRYQSKHFRITAHLAGA